ncbi:MAG: hypothetical protein DRP12_03525 [Candidatus Aenigmatarchaeota archaeon]|nr:MAG: hypothetical protein DRP12_03525 [Candidatus Aenigmarchaeota archaeon]
MVEVIKRDGRKEAFDPEKIKHGIRAAGGRTDVLPERIEELAEKIAREIQEIAEKRGEIRTSEIRAMVLERLAVEEPSIEQEFRLWPKTEKPEAEEFK